MQLNGLIEWVSDFCLMPIFLLYHGKNTVNFQWNDDEVSFVLDPHA